MLPSFPKIMRVAGMGPLLLAGLFLFSTVHAHDLQTSSGKSITGADALDFLNQVFERYARASTYHIEFVEENQISGDLTRTWDKSTTTAIVGPNRRYRFEKRADGGWGLQVSDGETEWTYEPAFRQYTQRKVPPSGPSRFESVRAPGMSQLADAQNTLKHFSAVQKLIRSGTYLPDQTIEINGKQFGCTVVLAKAELRNVHQEISVSFIFWVDKNSKVIRKQEELRDGPLRPALPETQYSMRRTTSFTVADLDTQVDNSLFSFFPPAAAVLVTEFEDPARASIRRPLGLPAPPVEFRSPEGKTLSLRSLVGKPVLLDFWATWCAPCVESLPALDRLYQDTVDKGLVLISVDDDEEAKTAVDFWAKHKHPWANFHDRGEISRAFPDHGIPYFVLIDASGNVVFSKEGLDEPRLREAIANLGPQFASAAEPPAKR